MHVLLACQVKDRTFWRRGSKGRGGAGINALVVRLEVAHHRELPRLAASGASP
jgi:hypothetical protein